MRTGSYQLREQEVHTALGARSWMLQFLKGYRRLSCRSSRSQVAATELCGDTSDSGGFNLSAPQTDDAAPSPTPRTRKCVPNKA